jgi:hypothetical protein
MKKLYALIIPVVLLAACRAQPSTTPQPSPTATSEPVPETRPDDFYIQYYWEVGPLEPLYFYSYKITVGSEIPGEIVFEAGYSGDEHPVWTEAFNVAESDLDQLYTMLYDTGVFSEEWHEAEDIPIGGSADKISIYAHGRQFSIPSFAGDEYQARDIRAVYDFVNALVPEDIWDSLLTRHDQYILENEDE